jgi:hypothetical protein
LFSLFLVEDSSSINKLAAYPADIRNNAFLAATQPDGITWIINIQRQSNIKFRNLIAPYSLPGQQKLWNLTRYNGLI